MPAEDLHRVVRRLEALVREEGLDDRRHELREIGGFLAFLLVLAEDLQREEHRDIHGERAGALHEAARGDQQAAHIREHHDRVRGAVRVLRPRERAARKALIRVGDAVLIGHFADRDALNAHAHARAVHHAEHAGHARRLRLLHFARFRLLLRRASAEAIGHRVVEVQHGGRVPLDAHLLFDGAAGNAVAARDLAGLLVDQHLRHHEEVHRREIVGELAVLVRHLRDHHVDDVVRHVVIAARDEDLGAGDAVGAVFLRNGLGLHQLQVRAAMRLGEAHGAGPFAGDHLLRDVFLHPGFARRPERGIGGRRQPRIHGEGLVRRHAHFREGEGDDGGQPRAARFHGRAEAVPAVLAIFLEGFLEAGRRAHDAVFQHAAMLVAHLVQGLQHFLAEFRAAFEDRLRHVRRQVAEARHLAALVDFEKLVEQEHEVFHGGLVARHGRAPLGRLSLLKLRLVSRIQCHPGTCCRDPIHLVASGLGGAPARPLSSPSWPGQAQPSTPSLKGPGMGQTPREKGLKPPPPLRQS